MNKLIVRRKCAGKKEKSTVLSPAPAEKSLPRGGLSARARGACSLATVDDRRRLLEAPARGERGRGGASAQLKTMSDICFSSRCRSDTPPAGPAGAAARTRGAVVVVTVVVAASAL